MAHLETVQRILHLCHFLLHCTSATLNLLLKSIFSMLNSWKFLHCFSETSFKFRSQGLQLNQPEWISVVNAVETGWLHPTPSHLLSPYNISLCVFSLAQAFSDYHMFHHQKKLELDKAWEYFLVQKVLCQCVIPVPLENSTWGTYHIFAVSSPQLWGLDKTMLCKMKDFFCYWLNLIHVRFMLGLHNLWSRKLNSAHWHHGQFLHIPGQFLQP